MKTCGRCGEAKPRDDFYNHKGRLDGKYPYCKACHNADMAARKAKMITVSNGMTDLQVFALVNRRAAPAGVEGWHWQYTGKSSSARSTMEVTQRLSQIADGHPLPDPVEFWCHDKFPWCVNIDHVIPYSDLSEVDSSEVFLTTEDGELEANGFSLVAEDDDSPAARLRRMEEIPEDPIDYAANKFLAEHGYDRHGQPFKNRRHNRKDQS